MSYQCISIDAAKSIMEESEYSLVDIRDPESYAMGHIEGALHITNDNVQEFLGQVDKSKPLIVVCYHGNSSQGAADFFASQGCQQALSMDGGFEEWRQRGESFVRS